VISGSPAIFAVESGVTEFYRPPSQRALGFFNIHVSGSRYGAYKPDATLLANSFDEVGRRIADRGTHTCDFSDSEAASIADSFSLAVYSDLPEGVFFFGRSPVEFSDIVRSRCLMWAPDGDEAFDDGSFVLQFDVANRVRVIAFKRNDGPLHDQGSLNDLWLEADEFYSILQHWYDEFESEWAAATARG